MTTTTTTASAVLDNPSPAASHSTGTASEHASASATGVEATDATTTDPAAATATADENTSDGLLTDEQFNAVKSDPDALRKAMNTAFTQKTQALSKERKALGAWAEIRDAFNEDAPAALKALAAQLGMEVRDPDPASGGKAPTGTTTTTTDAGDEAVAALKGALEKAGLEDLAEALAPVIRSIAETAASKATEPIKKQTDQVIRESALRESEAVLEAFGKKYPDWSKHEEQMTALSAKFPPGKGVTEIEYLETLYFLATKDTQIAKGVKEIVEKMTTSAAAAGEQPGSTVTGNKVQAKRPEKAGFRQAFEAAKRGEVWND